LRGRPLAILSVFLLPLHAPEKRVKSMREGITSFILSKVKDLKMDAGVFVVSLVEV